LKKRLTLSRKFPPFKHNRTDTIKKGGVLTMTKQIEEESIIVGVDFLTGKIFGMGIEEYWRKERFGY